MVRQRLIPDTGTVTQLLGSEVVWSLDIEVAAIAVGSPTTMLCDH